MLCRPCSQRNRNYFYHYTSIEGAIGILTSRNFWATNIHFLNDASEGEMNDEAMRSELSAQLKAENLDRLGTSDRPRCERAAIAADKLVDIYKEEFNHRYPRFIASFCTHDDSYSKANGLLSQWRGYGASTGVCLCFDTHAWVDFIKQQAQKYGENLSFMPVTYVESPLHIDPIIWKEMASKWVKNKNEQAGANAFLHDLYAVYVKEAPFFKHMGFREEKEHRLMLTMHRESQREIKIRQRGNAGVLYVDLFKEEIPLPSKLIVGPGLNAHETANQLRVWLKSKKFALAVEVSATPYRT
jgi:Protein of unknown function (DUF2971)